MFKGNPLDLKKDPPTTIELVGSTLPTSNDAYFLAKQEEIIDQYRTAQIFIEEALKSDFDYWFDPIDDENAMKYFNICFSSQFYEAALFFYNSVVDLSWSMVYCCAEFACNKGKDRVDYGGIKSIEEAYDLLRIAEKNVTNPTVENNPFQYLKNQNPQFTKAINMIIDFWEAFQDSSIRKNYNYLKHRGKPLYTEAAELKNSGFATIIAVAQKGEPATRIISNPDDVRYKISLSESIQDLIKFDDDRLFDYLKELIEELYSIIEPSPWAR